VTRTDPCISELVRGPQRRLRPCHGLGPGAAHISAGELAWPWSSDRSARAYYLAVTRSTVPEDPPVDAVVNPRLTDQLGIVLAQEDADFAIPRLRDDLPLALDPFLLWKSLRPEYRAMHEQLLGFVETVRAHVVNGRATAALEQLLRCHEAVELGLGYGRATKRGSGIGPKLANDIVDTIADVPQLAEGGLTHIEMLGLVVPLVAEDRISDLTASVLRGFLIDYTAGQAGLHGIPTQKYRLDNVWDAEGQMWTDRSVALPSNPLDGTPMLFAPLDLLRHLQWINYEDYYKSAFARLVLPPNAAQRRVVKAAVLERNRRNFVAVERYVESKEVAAADCQPDPLFEPLKATTLKRKLKDLEKIDTGRDGGADKKYEQIACDLLTSLLHPELDFAADQVRTDSGAHIRDVVFYNDGKNEFLKDLRHRFSARQIVFELKNTAVLSGENVNQLYRYLDDEFGKVGVLVTRRPAPRSVLTNITDLHSSKGAVILVLTDDDLRMMLSFVGTARRPSDVLKRAYIDFTRRLPK
jgi:hypothetical protein